VRSARRTEEIRAGSDARGLSLLAHHDLGGHGDGFQVLKRGPWLYVAHLGKSPMALSILDCSDPEAPRLVRQVEHPPNTRCHKVQIVGDVMIQNAEEPYWLRGKADGEPMSGVRVFDLSDPTDPRQVGFHPAGRKGAHRLWFDEAPYAHIASYLPGARYRSYEILDLSDPADPQPVGSWSIPGTFEGDPDPWPMLREAEHFGVHSVIPCGDRAYAACMDAGFVILDITNLHRPTVLGRVDWSPPFGGYVHTTLPLRERGIVIAVDEALEEHKHGGEKLIWVVDVREERQPVTIATFPVPRPPASTGASSYHELPGSRFGPHNVHENRTGSYASDSTIFATYFKAGLRVYDISDKFRPEEIGHFVPPAPRGQEGPLLNDLYVDPEGIVYATDRELGGLYVLRYDGP
jgi:hypothetical protein